MSVLGALLKLSYQLQEHHWSDWSLQRWFVIILTAYAGFSALRWVPGGWLGTVLAACLVLLTVGCGFWARLQGYVIYQSQERFSAPTPQSPMLLPGDKDRVLLHVTGNFAVEGKVRYFVALQAYYANLRTREHVIMALVPRSRLLFVGQRPGTQVGMWYIFFPPSSVQNIERGQLWFGASARPVIRVQYQGEKRLESLYLSLDDALGLERVLADLRHDAPQATPPTPGLAQAVALSDQATPTSREQRS